MMGAFVADWIKMRRTWILALVVLGPFGVISLTAVRYALDYTRLVTPGGDNWGNLLFLVNSLLVPALILGIAIVASMMAGLEHQGHQWKQLLALPVGRTTLYLSKFIWLMILLAAAACLATVGMLILGFGLGIESSLPLSRVLAEGFQPYLAAYALMGLQLLLSVLLANQVYGIVAGVVGIILAFTVGHVPNWLPWEYPFLASPLSGSAPGGTVIEGILVGLGLLVVGTVWFVRHEVH